MVNFSLFHRKTLSFKTQLIEKFFAQTFPRMTIKILNFNL